MDIGVQYVTTTGISDDAKVVCRMLGYSTRYVCLILLVSSFSSNKIFHFNFQIFRSWVATSHLRPPMAFLSHNSPDPPGLTCSSCECFYSEGGATFL